MPSAAARRLYEDQIPPFMSVFDLDAETMADRDTVTLVDPKLVHVEAKAPALANPPSPPDLDPPAMPPDVAMHKHHDSTSTQMSESTDSSPTTTLSITDSASLSDPSPSSSPDSPVNLMPLNNYPSTSFGCRPSHAGGMLSIPEVGAVERPMTSPAPRRPRNMKGLSIQPPSASMTMEPSSPSFIRPNIPAMKRKPSQLSLKTGTSDLMARSSLEVPPSPAMPPILQRRALKHSMSSPHMLTGLKSCTFGPPGGMSFPRVLERNESGLSEVLRPMKSSVPAEFHVTITEEASPIKTQLAKRNDVEPYNGSANNEDQKSPGYPDGPIAIYGDDVYLYSEPTAEEASQFDVVINAAREVTNPFDNQSPTGQQCPLPAPRGESPAPDTAASTATFATALEFQPAADRNLETPTTPRANPLKTPEYIHVPWDHSTDIAPDLMRLCETIDRRVKEGKKVLVHCQQGASRSASLIIAYGLYQRPEMSVNDAYYAAQSKSRWISPNMKLMYSLQDFHRELSKRRVPPSSAYRPRTGRSPTKHRLTLSADGLDAALKEPHTAPLPGEGDGEGDAGSSRPSTRPRGSSSPGTQAVSPGPASAPLTWSWREQAEDKPPPARPTSVTREPLKRQKSSPGGAGPAAAGVGALWPLPSRRASAHRAALPGLPNALLRASPPTDAASVERTLTVPSPSPGQEALMSPRAEAMTSNPLHGLPHIAGLGVVETAAPTPAATLFSPRQSIFARDQFSFFGRIASLGRPPQAADPRSPPTRGEAPIIRSIDDVL